MRPLSLSAGIILMFVSTPAWSQPATPLPESDVRREELAFENARSSRYMEQACRDTVYEGWTGFPVQRCTYAMRDRQVGSKTAEVVLLDAPPRQLARWVVRACLEVKQSTAVGCTRQLRRRIIEQSGAQFPVAGVVMEDMDGDGVQNIFVFRDGVTCRVAGITNGSTAQLTAEQMERALSGPVVRVGVYGRIASTTREEYRANGGAVQVGTSQNRGPAWRQVVRELYQQAWSSDRNELLIAWARANL